MKDYRVVAKDSLVRLIEQSEESRMPSDWMKANGKMYWDRFIKYALSDLTNDILTLDEAVRVTCDRIWTWTREQWGSSLTTEHYEAIMALFGFGIIHEFQTPYGENFDVFEFDVFWDEFHWHDDDDSVDDDDVHMNDEEPPVSLEEAQAIYDQLFVN